MKRGFQVTVRGRLDSHFVTVFGSAEVEARGRSTMIRGHYVDQSNLDGILAYFRNLGMELVSVETWEEPTAGSLATPEESRREVER